MQVLLLQLPPQEEEEVESLIPRQQLAGVGAEAGEDPRLQSPFPLCGLQLLLGEEGEGESLQPGVSQ